MKPHPLIFAGEERMSDRKIDVIFPYSNEVVFSVCSADKDDTLKAIEIAESSFHKTRHLSVRQRIEILDKIRHIIEQKFEDLARTITLESGKTITEARGEVARSMETLRLSAIAAQKSPGELLAIDSAPNGKGKWGYYKRFPIGTAGFITPFNFPLNLVMHKVAPAIAVGCPFILKPASKTPLTALKLGKIVVDAGYPKEAVHVLPGSGKEVGETIVASDRVKTISFTGSPEVGTKIAKLAGIKPVALELGSNSAVIIDETLKYDDLVFASERATLGAFAVAGQVCISTQRIYVHTNNYLKFINLLKTNTKRITYGDPRQETTKMGSMITQAEASRIMNMISNSEGEIIQGGTIDPDCKALLTPTIITNVPENSELIKSELFAPVVIVNPVKSFEEALEKTNNSIFGLQAGVFTRDITRADEAYEILDVGGVIINDIPTFRADLMPYGGNKQSGLLREGPEFALEHLTTLKACITHKL